MKICKNCKNEMEDDALFCGKCGAKFETSSTELVIEKQKKKIRIFNKKALVVCLLLILLAGLKTGGLFLYRALTKDYINRALYLKNSNIYVSDGKEGKNFAISEDLFGELLEYLEKRDQQNQLNNALENTLNSDEPEVESSSLVDEFYSNYNDLDDYTYENIVTLCSDTKRIIFPDNYNGESDGFELYWRSLKDFDEEPIKIDSKVEDYELAENNYLLFYQRSDGLYIYDFVDSQKIMNAGEEYAYIYSEGSDENGDIHYSIRKSIDEDATFESNAVICSKENRIVFPDNIHIGYSDGYYDLSWKLLDGINTETIKVDSKVYEHILTADNQKLYYLKKDGLYVSDFKESKQIIDSSRIMEWIVDETGENIVYVVDNKDLTHNIYLKRQDELEILLAENCFDYSLEIKENSSFNNIFYRVDYGLYKATLSGEISEVFVSNQYIDFMKVYDAGTAYYCAGNNIVLSGTDMVEDDMLEFDSALEEPIEPEKPKEPEEPDYHFSWWGELSAEEEKENVKMKKQYEKAYAQYEKDLEQYEEKYEEYTEAYDTYLQAENRWLIREQLEEQLVEYNEYSYYYFDGTQSYMLGKRYNTYSEEMSILDRFLTVAEEREAAICEFTEDFEMEKVKLSDLSSAEEVSISIIDEQIITFNSSFYIISKGQTEKLVDKSMVKNGDAQWPVIYGDGEHIKWNEDESILTYIEYNADVNQGDLKQITFQDGIAQEPQLIDSDVWQFYLEEGQLFYQKFSQDNKLDLYVNQTQIIQNVAWYSREYIGNALYLIADWDWDRGQGVLYQYEDGQLNKIAEDIHDFTVWPEGKVYYLKNYSIPRMEGELYCLKNGKEELLDRNVLAVLSYLHLNIR